MKTKVDIVSGFLGSGKTTLIKKLVTEEYKGENIVVVENELGKVNIDGGVLKSTGIVVEEITAGCICCSLTEDFISSIMKVKERFNADRIIIEPTGVAKLSEILNICKDKKYEDLIEINNVVTVVDVKRFELSISYSKEFIDDQIRITKSIILSKTSGIEDTIIQDVVNYIKKINNTVNIVNLQWEKATAKEIINDMENRYEIVNDRSKLGKIVGGRIHPSNSSHKFDTWEFETNKNFNPERIENIFRMLKNESEYGNIIRGKGILKDTEDQWFKFDFVPGDITFDEYTTEGNGSICIIGLNLNKNNILKLFI